MRLVTFNIRHGAAAGAATDNWQLVAACVSLRADVLALQEVDRNRRRSGRAHQAAMVAEVSGLEHVYAPTQRKWLCGRYGNALLARRPIADVEVLRLPVTKGREPRNAIVARVAVSGSQLSVAATHLQNRIARGEPVAADYAEQFSQLDAVLDALGERPEPRALLGDLNTRPPFARQRLEAAGFVVPDPGPTFPVRSPSIVLDYVAVTGLAVEGSEVIATPVSDHCALAVDAITLRDGPRG